MDASISRPRLRDRVGDTRVIRLLVVSQATFNVGFYMVVPYLALHLTGDLGLSAAVVGVVLGLRTFSQQGLFVVGGWLADRFGTKWVVVAGCGIRVGGLVGLAYAEQLVPVLLAAVATGFAAALFSPAVEAELAREAGLVEASGGAPRTRAFAQFGVGGEVGALAGPVVGSLLLLVGFQSACLVAAALFVVVMLAHARLLPAVAPAHGDEPVLAAWPQILGNRPFVVFAVGFAGSLVAYTQLYLLLPVQVDRATTSSWPVGALFALAAVVVVLGQQDITRVAGVRLGHTRSLTVGFATMAVAPVPVAVSLLAGLDGWWVLLPLTGYVVVLTVGHMLVLPVGRDVVARLARGDRLGAHYGVVSSVGGVAVVVVMAVTGRLVDLPGRTGDVAPWLLAAAVPLVGVLVLRRVQVPDVRPVML